MRSFAILKDLVEESDSENMAPVQEVLAFYGQPATDGQDKLGIVKEGEMRHKLPITRSESVSYGVGTEEVCLRKTEFEFVDDKRQIRFEEKFDSFKKTQTISRNPSQITSPCVSYDLDEGQGEKLKTIQQSKGKKHTKKSAVENDDVSQFERDPFACKSKFVNGEKVSGKTIDLKSKGENSNFTFQFCKIHTHTHTHLFTLALDVWVLAYALFGSNTMATRFNQIY